MTLIRVARIAGGKPPKRFIITEKYRVDATMTVEGAKTKRLLGG
jgi:hypothetical protein